MSNPDFMPSTTHTQLMMRLNEAEQHMDELRRENARLRHDFNGLAAKFETALVFFESRVDAVYQSALRTPEERNSPEVVTTDIIERRLQKMIYDGFETKPSVDALELKDIISGELSPGVKRGALTLYGFRLHPSAARDLGNCIRIEAGEFGAVVFGPYKRIRPGKYRLKFTIEIVDLSDDLTGSMTFDVFDGAVGESVASTMVPAGQLERSNIIQLSMDWNPRSPNHLAEIRVFQGLSSQVLLSEIALEYDGE